jgi:hypothetical protein
MFDADKRSQVCPAFPDAPRSVLLPRPLPLPPHQATRTAPVGSQLAAPDKACCRPKLADRAHARAYERTSATRGMLRLRAGGNGAASAYPARAFRNGLDRAVRTPPAASPSSPSSQRPLCTCMRARAHARVPCMRTFMDAAPVVDAVRFLLLLLALARAEPCVRVCVGTWELGGMHGAGFTVRLQPRAQSAAY